MSEVGKKGTHAGKKSLISQSMKKCQVQTLYGDKIEHKTCQKNQLG